MSRSRHPHGAIEAAVRYAEEAGWTYVKPGKSAHAWGHLRCPGDCSQVSVWSTPKNPESHARLIRKAVDRCPHGS